MNSEQSTPEGGGAERTPVRARPGLTPKVFCPAPGTAAALRLVAGVAETVKAFRPTSGTAAVVQSAATIAAAVAAFQSSPAVADAIRTTAAASAALKDAQLSPTVTEGLKRFETAHHDLIKHAAPALQVPTTSAARHASPIARPLDVAALVDAHPKNGSARNSTRGPMDGQQTNTLLEKAVEAMTALTDLQRQMLDVERVKREATERREKVARADAAAAWRRERHQSIGMWIGVAVGVVGAVAALLAL